MEHKPLKRSPHIVALSQDHHLGLLFCWKIKEGLKKGIHLSRIKAYLNYYWQNHLLEHFREEETLLFNEINNALIQRGRDEHLLLSKLANKIVRDNNFNNADFLSFAELLTKHIRFEERILFPQLEAELPTATLVAAGIYLNQQHATHCIDNYPDQFWVDEIKPVK
ncbi:hemerythrin domain-containing protein [Mucilaginibacter sp.]|jgi:hypothetical protein|uniref:hemerythrin domain-containing protein n=1 Tax=Mucilaginibacter sp. TaxID=1882438 RepID=UPI002BAB5AA3|nr:hemerythrin domain-containing protein [Mucilaginibacter sp.]HTI58634.1 hemerythrin domain-containing protein [Mucilaginibacter sp.]